MNREDILKRSFTELMTALRKAQLLVGWENKLKTLILPMRQGDQPFINWYHSMAGRNFLLRNTSYHLSPAQIQDQLEANMPKELSVLVEYEKVVNKTDFESWLFDVQRIDNDICKTRGRQGPFITPCFQRAAVQHKHHFHCSYIDSVICPQCLKHCLIP